MDKFRADLHCHTNCSDGSMSPKEILVHAKKIGLQGLSITDHDTVSAYHEAIPIARELGILLGSGVEFSSVDQGVSIHILGYDIDLESKELIAFCKRHLERRRERNRKILEKLQDRGILIELEEEGEEHPAGRPHIALALVEQGIVASSAEAFKKLIGDGCPCFDPGNPISTDETIALIHKAGGKAFLAHPHLLKSSRALSHVMKKPLDGIECYYAKCSPSQEQKWVRLAREKGLLMSGGSDFHGMVKPQIPLGCSWIDREGFDQIFEKHL